MHHWKASCSSKKFMCVARRFILLMGGFLLFFIAFFTVHAVFKVGALDKPSFHCCWCHVAIAKLILYCQPGILWHQGVLSVRCLLLLSLIRACVCAE